jgi:murein DD-endopeptidase MepM/ murein hydrolase activator NlpD
LLVAIACAMLGSILLAAPVSARPPRFLTLPFRHAWQVRIQDGWWRWDHDRHAGIDYVRGRIDQSWTWRSFPVRAAAGGWACAARNGRDGCINGVGTRVVIRHRVKGRTFYTYYGHLASVSKKIPLGVRGYTVRVRRGQIIGRAGHSGNPPGVIHLHLEIVVPPFRSLDPYALYAYRERYPDPGGTNGKGCGRARLWIDCPPAAPPKREPTASAEPTAPAEPIARSRAWFLMS